MSKVLIIDDNESILEAVSIAIESEGYTVDTTTKWELAQKKVKSFHPDLILLDVLLAGKDGREIAYELKHNPTTEHIPIIMISAHPNAEASIKEAGANAFLPKPFDLDDLLNLVARFTAA